MREAIRWMREAIRCGILKYGYGKLQYGGLWQVDRRAYRKQAAGAVYKDDKVM